MAQTEANNRVAIFRHTLFKRSEQFIPLQALALRNSDVTMIARDSITNPVKGLDTVTLKNLGRGIKFRHTVLADSRPLNSILNEGNFDVIHAHFGVEGLYSFSAARKSDIPHFTTLHGYDVTRSSNSFITSGKPAWVRYGMQRREFLSSETNLICVSNYIQKKAIELGANYENTHVIGTGVNTSDIFLTHVPDTPTILNVGRLVENKGTTNLISAFSMVVKRFPDSQLKIIGEGPLLPLLKAQVESLGIINNVFFFGNQPHNVVLDEIRKSRLLCLPSVTAKTGETEGLGQVILEASATGRPVLASKLGGIPEGIIDGITGTLVEERDVHALAAAMTEYLSDWRLCQEQGSSGRDFVEEYFDVYKQAHKVEELYRRVSQNF